MLPEIKNIKMQQEDIRVNQIGAMDSPQILLPDPQTKTTVWKLPIRQI